MPYASAKQQRFFNANRSKLEEQGVDVDEWNASSKGKKLPEKAKLKKSAAAVLMTVLQLNNLKHAMDSLGLKPTPPGPKPPNKQRRPHVPLNPPPVTAQKPVPTQKPADPPPKQTPAEEVEPAAGSVLMPGGK